MAKANWKVRRFIVVSTLIFCAFCVLWILFSADERGVLEIIVMSSYGLAASTIGAYVFGVAWDDQNIRKMRRRPLEDDAQEEPPA